MREEHTLGFHIIRDKDYRSGRDYYVVVNERDHRKYGKYDSYYEAREFVQYYIDRTYAKEYHESESERSARLLREKAQNRNNKIDQILG